MRIDHTILQMSKAPKKDDVMIGAIRIVHNDSTKDVEEAITNSASNALRALCKGEKLQYTEVAEQVKKEMEQMQPGAWHVIVGKSFGSFVTHEVKWFEKCMLPGFPSTEYGCKLAIFLSRTNWLSCISSRLRH